jgi:diazepam-binding inhibitor (GABA receptor modulator, acyl-CoA-binding protein)
MSDLQAEFERAVADSRKLGQRPDNPTLLRIYGLYKQGTAGDVTTAKPGFSDLVGRAKWDAWNALKGMPREDAMREYVELIRSLE